jgi:coenzyme F420 hydrogenase subunit beta
MIELKAITDVPRANLCHSCGACEGVCHFSAVTISPNSGGILVPTVDPDACKCSERGLCLKVCPGYEMDIPHFQQQLFAKHPEHPEIGNFIHIYAGYAANEDTRKSGRAAAWSPPC